MIFELINQMIIFINQMINQMVVYGCGFIKHNHTVKPNRVKYVSFFYFNIKLYWSD
jgi:hypothetical protein